MVGLLTAQVWFPGAAEEENIASRMCRSYTEESGVMYIRVLR